MTESQFGKNNWSKYRWLILLFGTILLGIGQWRLNAQVIPSTGPTKLAVWLNKDLHFGIENLDNIQFALPLLIVGGILFVVGLRGVTLLPSDRVSSERPFEGINYFLGRWPWLLVGSLIFALLILQINSNDPTYYQLPALLLILIIFASVMAGWDRKREVDLSPHLKRIDWLWMTGLMCAGFFVGAYHLQGFPDQLIGDEGNFWTVARDIAMGLFKPSIFAPGVYSFPVFSSFVQAWFLRIFGLDMWGWRFGCVFMGVITVLPLYLVAREMYNRKVAILASIALITNPYFVDFSRISYISIQSLFFIALTLYWLYVGVHRKSALYLFLAGGMAGMGFYTFFAARFGIVISLAFIGLLWIGRKISFREMISILTVIGLGFVLVVAPFIFYGISVDPSGMSYKMWESVFFNSFNGLAFYTEKEVYAFAPPFTINGNVLFYNPRIYLVLIARGLALTMIVFQRAGIIPQHFIAFPLAGTFGALFYLIGLILAIRSINQPRNLLLLLWFSANVIGLSALNTVPPRQTHMLAIIPALALLIGLGLNAFGVTLTTLYRRLGKIGMAFLVMITMLVALGGLYDFFGRVPKHYPAPPDQVMSWAGLNSNGESIVYLYTDPSQKDLKPYVMEEFRKEIKYENIAAQKVLNGEKIFSNQPTVVFYPPEASEDIEPILRRQWGDSFKHRIFKDANGIPILFAGMNTPFVFEQDKTFLTILLESYGRPSLWPLLLGLLLSMLAVRFFPSKWTLRIPAPFIRLADWFNAPVSMPVDVYEDDPFDWPSNIPSDKSVVMEEIAGEPPEWALEQGFIQAPENSRLETGMTLLYSWFKPVRVEYGTDYYIKIHVPHFRLPNISFPWMKSSNNQQEGISISLPQIKVPIAVLLIFSVVFAIIAQILINNQLMWPGALTYFSSMLGLFIWARKNPKWKNIFAIQLQMNRSGEFILVGLILIVTICIRFFDLNSHVYGLEIDEAKWTIQSWYSTILHIDSSEFGPVFYKYFPVDFWTRSLFLRIFGLNFMSARIESAVFSLIAILFLYLLVRLITSSAGTALLSALLLSFSFIELNASHQALSYTSPEVWMLVAFTVLFLAIRTRSLWQFQMSGFLLALGMLTYETFYPNFIVVMIYLSGLAIYEIVNKRTSVQAWFKALILVAWPITIVYIEFVHPYITQHQLHLLGSLGNLTDSQQGILGAVQFITRNSIGVLESTFSSLTLADSLITWGGPIINPLLLPFIVIGFTYNLWNIRRPHYAFIPLWYFLQALLGSILPDSIWPGTMYLGMPALFIWGAFGLWTTFAALRALLEGERPRTAIFLFGLLLAVIIFNDYRIFKTQTVDSEERQKRRELADLTIISAKDSSFLLYPFVPNKSDFVQAENDVILFSVAGARNLGLDVRDHFKLIEMDHLLSELWLLKDQDDLDIILDKTAPDLKVERQRALDVVLKCYPEVEMTHQGTFFNVYHFGSQTLQSPGCYSQPAPETTAPKNPQSTSGPNPPLFKWNANNLQADSFIFKLDRKRDDIIWIEVEDAFQGYNWFTNGSFVEGFSGSGFLYDGWDAGEAPSSIDISQPGPYRIWVRYYKRLTNDQHNFITVGGQTSEFAENDGLLNEWVWKSVGVYDLRAGPNPIALTRTYGIDEEYSVFIDSIVITADVDFHPDLENDIWKNIISTAEINSRAAQYIPPQILGPGDYRWKVHLYDGTRLVDSEGNRGIDSDFAKFTIPKADF